MPVIEILLGALLLAVCMVISTLAILAIAGGYLLAAVIKSAVNAFQNLFQGPTDERPAPMES